MAHAGRARRCAPYIGSTGSGYSGDGLPCRAAPRRAAAFARTSEEPRPAERRSGRSRQPGEPNPPTASPPAKASPRRQLVAYGRPAHCRLSFNMFEGAHVSSRAVLASASMVLSKHLDGGASDGPHRLDLPSAPAALTPAPRSRTSRRARRDRRSRSSGSRERCRRHRSVVQMSGVAGQSGHGPRTSAPAAASIACCAVGHGVRAARRRARRRARRALRASKVERADRAGVDPRPGGATRPPRPRLQLALERRSTRLQWVRSTRYACSAASSLDIALLVDAKANAATTSAAARSSSSRATPWKSVVGPAGATPTLRRSRSRRCAAIETDRLVGRRRWRAGVGDRSPRMTTLIVAASAPDLAERG